MHDGRGYDKFGERDGRGGGYGGGGGLRWCWAAVTAEMVLIGPLGL